VTLNWENCPICLEGCDVAGRSD